MEEFELLAKDGVLLHGTLHQYSEAFEAVDSDHDGEPQTKPGLESQSLVWLASALSV